MFAHPRLNCLEPCLVCIFVPEGKTMYCMRAVHKVEGHQTVFFIQQTNRLTSKHFFMNCLSIEWCLVLRFPSSAIGSKELTNHQTFCFCCPIIIGLYVACTCFPTLGNSDVFLFLILIGSFFFQCAWEHYDLACSFYGSRWKTVLLVNRKQGDLF